MDKIIDVFFTQRTREEILKLANDYVESYYPEHILDIFMSKDTIRICVYKKRIEED